MGHYEIVKIVDGEFLLDSANRRLRYRPSGDRPLRPGAYYAVLWEGDGSAPRYDDDNALYCGPYELPHLARRDSLEHLKAFRAHLADRAAFDPS
jgi:hypothetical protein